MNDKILLKISFLYLKHDEDLRRPDDVYAFNIGYFSLQKQYRGKEVKINQRNIFLFDQPNRPI